MAIDGTGREPAIEFDIKTTTSTKKINDAFKPYLQIPKELFGSKILQKYLVQRVRNRFKRKGTHPVAQKDPHGVDWKPLAPSTIARGRDTDRKLFDKGALSRSIAVVKDRLDAALYTNTGGGFRIGVKYDSGSYRGRNAGDYARIQNYGGWSGRNLASWIPARRYLGIGQPDKDAVNLWIKRTMNRLKI